MSYATIKAGFVTVLTDNGYKEMENLMEVEDAPASFNHLHYILKVEGFPVELLTDDQVIGSHLFRLEVMYQNNDTTQRDTNYALFLILAKAVSAVSNFLGFREDASFLDQDDGYHTVGTLVFDAGAEC